MSGHEKETPVRIVPDSGLSAPRLVRDRRKRTTLFFPTRSREEAMDFLRGWRAAEPDAPRLPDDAELTAFLNGCAGRLGAGGPPAWRWADRRGYWGWLDLKEQIIFLNAELRAYPAECAEEVLAHECCHLLEREHTERFWALLRGLVPDWARREGVLRSLKRKRTPGAKHDPISGI